MPYHYLNSFYGNAPVSYPNFFNGRILTASDLLNERAAVLQTQQLLGQAIGEGVVTGLYVVKNGPGNSIPADAVTISAGLAIAPSGTPLHLTSNATVHLTDAGQPDIAAIVKENIKTKRLTTFSATRPPAGMNLIGATNTGFYLLAITPDSRYSTEVAPHSGLGGSDPTSGQGQIKDAHINDRQEHGVRFKLIPLTSQELLLSGNASKWRSHIAHRCLGTYDLEPLALRPHTLQPSYGLVDKLRAKSSPDLGADDVPLAVVSFHNSKVEWVDVWMVRRPCLPAQKPDLYLGGSQNIIAEIFPHVTGFRRQVEAQAFFLQFQTQLEELRIDHSPEHANPYSLAASEYFDYLPAAGYLHVGPIENAGAPVGGYADRFDDAKFFGRDIDIRTIEAPFLRTLFERALYIDPISTKGEIPVDLYEVKDEVKSSAIDATTRFLIFARHEPIAVAPPKEETPPPVVVEVPEVTTGNLFVTVMDPSGYVYTSIDGGITVTATNQTTSQSYTGVVEYVWNLNSREGFTYLNELSNKGKSLRKKYGYGEAEYDGILVRRPQGNSPTLLFSPILFAFRDLPAGTYTVLAAHDIPYTPGISTQAVVTKATDTNVTAILDPLIVIQQPSEPPVVYNPCAPIRLPKGISIDDAVVNPKWRQFVTDPFILSNAKVASAIDQWDLVDISDCYKVEIEKHLRKPVGPIPDPYPDPRVVIEDPRLYIRKDYDPTTQPAEVQAFVETKDGTRFPVVVVATDNTLNQSTTINRAEIAEYDTSTFNQLAKVGLTSLEVVAATPPQIIAGSLGLNNSTARDLAVATRTRMENDFQRGFMGYPGVTKAISDALVAEFKVTEVTAEGEVKLIKAPAVELANARPDAIAAAIANGIAPGSAATPEITRYAERMQADVRRALPAESFDLRAIGLNDEQVSKLDAKGIKTVGQLYDARAIFVKDEAGNIAPQAEGDVVHNGAVLLEVFDNKQDLVNSAVLAAAKGKAQGENMAVPQVSIANVAGMTPEVAAELSSQGIFTARQLANVDKDAVVAAVTEANPATTLNLETLTTFVDSSKADSYGFSTVVEAFASAASQPFDQAIVALGPKHSTIGSITQDVTGVLEALSIPESVFSTDIPAIERVQKGVDFKVGSSDIAVANTITDIISAGTGSFDVFTGGAVLSVPVASGATNVGNVFLEPANTGTGNVVILGDFTNTAVTEFGSTNLNRLIGNEGRFAGGQLRVFRPGGG